MGNAPRAAVRTIVIGQPDPRRDDIITPEAGTLRNHLSLHRNRCRTRMATPRLVYYISRYNRASHPKRSLWSTSYTSPTQLALSHRKQLRSRKRRLCILLFRRLQPLNPLLYRESIPSQVLTHAH